MLASWPNRILLLLAAGGVLAAFLTVGPAAQPTTRTRQVTVQRGVVQSTVSATGSLQSPQAVNLSFSSSGTLTHIYVKVGQHVLAHDLLATLDPITAQRSLTSARANLASAQGHLQQTLQPVSSPEQRQADAAVAQNRAAISGAKRSVAEARAAARQDARGQVLAVKQARTLLASAQAAAVQDARSLAAALAQANAQLAADQAQQNSDLAAQSTAQAAAGADAAKLAADQAKQSADGCTGGGSSPPPSCTADASAVAQDNARLSADNAKLSNSNTDATKVAQDQTAVTNAGNAQAAGAIKDAQSITQAEGAVNTALSMQSSAKLKDDSSVVAAGQQLTTAQGQLQATLTANAVKAQPPKPGDLASAQAGVSTARVSLAAAQQVLDETQLRAPASGVVGTVSGVVGESAGSGGSAGASSGGASAATASSGAGASGSSGSASTGSSSGSSGGGSSGGVVSLTSLHGLQLAAGFSESDATKIKLGQSATVTVDALPNHQLGAHVLQVSPTPTSSSGVVTFNVVFGLDQSVPGLKPGMSASVNVVTQQVDDALNVPSAALSRGRAGQTVSRQQGSKQVQVPVIVGLRGDSSVELLSGVHEGEQLTVTSAVISSSASSAGGSAGGGLPTGGGLGAGGGGFGGGGGGGGFGRAARGG